MGQPIFQPLPDKPDHPGLEQEILARWEEEGTFAKLREARTRPVFQPRLGDVVLDAVEAALAHHCA